MRKELEQKFQERWPTWFNYKFSGVEVSLGYGFFAHGDGWFDLVWRLCEQIEPVVLAGNADTREFQAPLDTTKQPPFQVCQVKEKFGSLRFHTNSNNRLIFDLIQQAEEHSALICDICGKPGTLRRGGWRRTKCDEHIETRQRY